MTTQRVSETSWSVVEVDEFHTIIAVYGAFTSEQAARDYARRAFYLGREVWNHEPVHHNSFDVAPWRLANPEYRKASIE
jgi:hypothetical protein